MGKKKEFVVPSRRQPVWKVVGGVLKWFFKKPTIINLNEGELPSKAIFVANHSAMNGPVVYSLYLPAFTTIWGAGQMLGNYNSRFHYLRDVYFMQKRHMKKFPATIIAGFEALFSIFFYRGMKILPTFTDGRLRATIHNSVKCLNNDVCVTVFPEDSSTGYHEVLTGFFPGFVMLAQQYRRVNKQDVPIYPVYYHKKSNTMVIGKPTTLADYPEMDRDQIAENFREQINTLLDEHILSKDQQSTQNDIVEAENTAVEESVESTQQAE